MAYLSRLNRLSRKLGTDWRDRVWDIVKDDRELAATFALILTFGSRPKELSMKDGKGGVTLSITPQGALHMMSECVKVKRSPFAWLDKGQEHRWATFAVDGQTQIDFLSDIVKRGGGELVLGYPWKPGARDRAAIAAHLSRVVRKVFSTAFPALDPASTYIGREIWSAELKTQASRLPEEDRATFVCHGMGPSVGAPLKPTLPIGCAADRAARLFWRPVGHGKSAT